MSYTVIHDQEYEQRIMVNEINKAVRHCRIGKVTMKTQPILIGHRVLPPFDPIATWRAMDHPRNCAR